MRDEIEQLYREHAKSVYQYLLSLSHDAEWAEELTQETFYRAMRTIGTYNGTCKIYVWLCQIAKHIWYQELEKQKKRQTTELREELPSQLRSPEDAVLMTAEKIALYQAIHGLGEPMREVVHMRLSGAFSFAEIGEVLGKTENWARVTFYRAKQKIMEAL